MQITTYASFTELWRLISPPWLLRTWGDPLIATFGDAQDEHHARTKAAVKARYPLQAPLDAVSRIGDDRGLSQAWSGHDARETYDAWRLRLSDAWALWMDAGTDLGILRALYWAGFEDCTAFPAYDPQDPTYVFDPDQSVIVASAHDLGADGRPDAPNTAWAVFWVIVDATANDVTLDIHTWDDGTGWDTWGDGVDNDWSSYGVWDFDESETTIARWRAAIQKWKPAHALCPHIIFRGSLDWADFWGPMGAWGDADEGVWGDSAEVASCSTTGEASV